MSLIHALTANAEQVETIKDDMADVLAATIQAAHDYAEGALQAANAAHSYAEEGAPITSVLAAYREFETFHRRANMLIEAVAKVSNMHIAINEGPDEEANDHFASYVMGLSKTEVVSAMLEGATRRITLMQQAIPAESGSGARFDPALWG